MSKTTPSVIKELRERYKGGESPYEIEKDVPISVSTIYKYLRREEIDKKDKRQYIPDDNVFSRQSASSLYWAGFLLADGHIHGNTIELRLAEKDKEHIKKFRNFLGFERPLYEYTDGECGVRVHSHQIVEDLTRFNVTEDKTLNASAPKFAAKNPDFWRGVVDGDGWVTEAHKLPSIGLVGTYRIIEQFLHFVKLYCPTNASPNPTTSPNVHRLGVTHSSLLPLLKAVYYGKTPSLDRKKEKALSLLHNDTLCRGYKTGENHHNAVLSEADVKEIWRDKHHTQKELGKIYGVSKSTIGAIKRREVWKSVTTSIKK